MRTPVLWAGLAVVLLGCDNGYNGEIVGPPWSGLSGTWEATRFEYSDEAHSVDLVALGGTFTVEFTGQFSCRLTIAFAGEPIKIVDGNWYATLAEFVISYDGTGYETTWAFEQWNVSATTLTLRSAWATYDFDDDGEEEPAFLSVDLVRK